MDPKKLFSLSKEDFAIAVILANGMIVEHPEKQREGAGEIRLNRGGIVQVSPESLHNLAEAGIPLRNKHNYNADMALPGWNTAIPFWQRFAVRRALKSVEAMREKAGLFSDAKFALGQVPMPIVQLSQLTSEQRHLLDRLVDGFAIAHGTTNLGRDYQGSTPGIDGRQITVTTPMVESLKAAGVELYTYQHKQFGWQTIIPVQVRADIREALAEVDRLKVDMAPQDEVLEAEKPSV